MIWIPVYVLWILQTTARCSTCVLVCFIWLLDHVIYLEQIHILTFKIVLNEQSYHFERKYFSSALHNSYQITWSRSQLKQTRLTKLIQQNLMSHELLVIIHDWPRFFSVNPTESTASIFRYDGATLDQAFPYYISI